MKTNTEDYMTSPEQFYESTMKSLNYLNTILPKNSTVILTGLAPGEVLWDTLHARQHPLGEFEENLSYEKFYDFLDCMDKVPTKLKNFEILLSYSEPLQRMDVPR